jgi:hypothetical protein
VVAAWYIAPVRIWWLDLLTPYSHPQLETTGKYNATAILHTLPFIVANALEVSVFNTCIVATDFSQSDRHFTSHIKSFHGLVPFLPLFCNCQFRTLHSPLSTTVLYSSSKAKSESGLLYDCGFPANQFVLASSPLRLTRRDIFPTELLR